MKDMAKIGLCLVLAAIATYFVGRHIGLVLGAGEQHSFLNVQFIGLVLSVIILTWEATDQLRAKLSKNTKATEA